MRISTHDRGNGSSTGLRNLPQPALRFRTAAVRAAGAWLSLTATVNALIPVTPGTLSPRPSRPCLGWPRGSARTCRFRDLGDPLGAVTLSKPRTSRTGFVQVLPGGATPMPPEPLDCGDRLGLFSRYRPRWLKQTGDSTGPIVDRSRRPPRAAALIRSTTLSLRHRMTVR